MVINDNNNHGITCVLVLAGTVSGSVAVAWIEQCKIMMMIMMMMVIMRMMSMSENI